MRRPNDTIADREFLTTDPRLLVPSGAWLGVYSVNKFGRSTNVDDAVATDVWDGANATDDEPTWIAPLEGGVKHNIVSTSASDTQASTTGANKIKIYGIGSWDEKEISEELFMQGTTPVETVNSYSVIHRMKVILSGVNATTANTGVISATTIDLATLLTAQINAEQGQTQMAVYGFPSTQSFYLTKFYASVLRASLGTNEAHADIQLLFNPVEGVSVGGTWLVKNSTSVGTRASQLQHDFNPYNKFTGPGILKIEATGSANNLDVSAGFDGILVDN